MGSQDQTLREAVGGVIVTIVTRGRVTSPQTAAALDDTIDHGGL